jgi:hypothetical protein
LSYLATRPLESHINTTCLTHCPSSLSSVVPLASFAAVLLLIGTDPHLGCAGVGNLQRQPAFPFL